ncbi:MAG: 4-(cytidine 5'-diphospho)-2-C-methyl-D-erythritol kinase [Cognatishimia activa]
MTAKVTAFAPAKINLTLHVTGRREDGYHLLDSLVAFADIGDEIEARAASEMSLSVSGPMSEGVPSDSRNLMLKAAKLFDPSGKAALYLTKHLPAASGIGGGSSDAAATLRALAELWDLPLPQTEDVLPLGADLPVCLYPTSQRMSGIGEKLERLPALPPCDILLVNPGVEVATPGIFKALTSRDNAPMTDVLPNWRSAEDLAAWLHTQRNDLEPPACGLAPEISDALSALEATNPLIARMSGSGATCFALFPAGSAEADTACGAIQQAHPNWWVKSGRFFSLAESIPG